MKLVLGLILVLAVTACKNAGENSVDGTEASENAQQIGDVMASIDEAGGKNDGSLAIYQKGIEKSFARVFRTENKSQVAAFVVPEAVAGSCTNSLTSGFASCNTGSKSITRTFSCSLHDAVNFSGTVVMTWGGGAVGCATTTNGDFVQRVPNITVTGRRGATLTITKSSTATIGQKLTRGASANEFTFTSDGINRKFTSGTQVVFNHTTQSTGVTITAAGTRLNRIITGGSIQVKNNISNVTCTYTQTANSVWTTIACNCPTQGSWQGTCDDGNGHTSSTSLVINGCGTGKYTEGAETSDVTFDRCGS